MDFSRYVYFLRAVDTALVTAYAPVCLAEFRYCSVVAYQVCATGFPVVLCLLAL